MVIYVSSSKRFWKRALLWNYHVLGEKTMQSVCLEIHTHGMCLEGYKSLWLIVVDMGGNRVRQGHEWRGISPLFLTVTPAFCVMHGDCLLKTKKETKTMPCARRSTTFVVRYTWGLLPDPVTRLEVRPQTTFGISLDVHNLTKVLWQLANIVELEAPDICED